MKNLTWQNPEQLFVAQELINKVKSKCCGIKGYKRKKQKKLIVHWKKYVFFSKKHKVLAKELKNLLRLPLHETIVTVGGNKLYL